MDVLHAFEARLTATPAPTRSMRAKLLREVAALGLPPSPGSDEVVTEADLEALPPTVKRYLRFMGVAGHPRVGSFCARWTGRFRMGPDRPWMPCEAWQLNASADITRVFHMRVRFGGLLPVFVRDTYVRGRGRMLGKVFDTVRIVDVADFKIDTGELVTYLNDALLLAPSMLLGPETSWKEVDDGAFDVALTDRGLTVRARVLVDERGAITDFSTTDRYGEDPARPGEMVRARWSTPVSRWTEVRGRPVVGSATAVWHFASGDLAYAELTLDTEALELDPPAAGALPS